MFCLPKIYPITDARLSGLSHARQVEQMAAGGATLIQLRDKHLSPRDLFEAAKEAIGVARHHSVRLVINDRADVALAVGADGVHLGQDDMPPAAARRLLRPTAIIGFSTHSIRQAIEAEEMPVDYIAVGPIFPTTSKANPDEVIGIEGLEAVRRRVTRPLVAIGGINSENIFDVFAAGADSAAVISAIIADGNEIAGRTQLLLQIAEKNSRGR